MAFDRLLDRAAIGPRWLSRPGVAEFVVQVIESGASIRRLYELHAFVVVPNHVHLLVTPHAPLSRITKWVKGSSARKANDILRQTGQPFWQDESFDHWVRDGAQFERIKRYIENNPVRAQLVKRPQDWPYSSAKRKAQAEGLCHTGESTG